MFKKLLHFLCNFDVARGELIDDVESGRAIHAGQLRDLLGTCPICHSDFTYHWYAQFAMTINDRDHYERVSDFIKAAEEHRWEALLTFSEFQGDRDTIIATALRCPGRRMALILEHDPWDFCDSRYIISCEVLEQETGQELGMLIEEDKWYLLEQDQGI